jgi:CheY-like chemotaxis protein
MRAGPKCRNRKHAARHAPCDSSQQRTRSCCAREKHQHVENDMTSSYAPPMQRLGPVWRAAAKVLCIDSDDDSRHLIAEVLYECDVDFGLTADDALQLARCRSYDLCFVDPATVGFAESDLDGQLRRLQPRTAIVICGQSHACRADLQPNAVLDKPLRASAIREVAQRLLWPATAACADGEFARCTPTW